MENSAGWTSGPNCPPAKRRKQHHGVQDQGILQQLQGLEGVKETASPVEAAAERQNTFMARHRYRWDPDSLTKLCCVFSWVKSFELFRIPREVFTIQSHPPAFLSWWSWGLPLVHLLRGGLLVERFPHLARLPKSPTPGTHSSLNTSLGTYNLITS